jgi:two-component system LytT family response regulator
MRLLLDHLKQSREYFDQIIIRDQKGFTVVNLADIIQCISYGYCTEFHLKDGHKIVSTRNLGYYQDILEDYGFMRVHHSHMISLKAIKSYSKEQVILMIDNSTVPLGNAYKKKFFNYISKSLG